MSAAWVQSPEPVHHSVHHGGPLAVGDAVDLVHDEYVCEQHVGLAGVEREFVPGPQGICDDDHHVGLEERQVVVAAVPQQDVGILLGQRDHVGVVDTGVDGDALPDGQLVLLALLDRRVAGVDVVERAESLHPHVVQVAVGHGVADQCHDETVRLQHVRDGPAGLALAGTTAGGAHRDDGLPAPKRCDALADQAEVGAGRDHPRREVHHVRVGDVGVREHHFVHAVRPDQLIQLGLRHDRDAGGVAVARQIGWVGAAVDVRDLRRGEGNDVHTGIVTEHDVERVEVASAGPSDDHALHAVIPRSGRPWSRCRSMWPWCRTSTLSVRCRSGGVLGSFVPVAVVSSLPGEHLLRLLGGGCVRETVAVHEGRDDGVTPFGEPTWDCATLPTTERSPGVPRRRWEASWVRWMVGGARGVRGGRRSVLRLR